MQWIDAICIGQGSHSERGHQIRQMDKIYRHAFRVIIWLGPLSDEPTCYLIDIMADLHKHMVGIG